jgi:hypothetical protein
MSNGVKSGASRQGSRLAAVPPCKQCGHQLGADSVRKLIDEAVAKERKRLMRIAEDEAELLDGEGMGPEANGIRAFIQRASQT